MLSLKLSEIVSETDAVFSGQDAVIHAVSTDTRDLPEGCLFVALKGDNFDGHNYIAQALENGAAFAVSMDNSYSDSDRVLVVGDTRDALLSIARLHRKTLAAKVTAITGSVGKTTTKEMIACVCESTFRTVKTEKNLNNEIGLSKTILALDENCEAAVLEMGSDGPGQITKLSRAALPDIGVVTSIGVSHIESFGSRENILAEKMSICDGLSSGANLILCGDNDMLKTVKRDGLNIIFYGIENSACAVLAANIHEYSSHTNFEIIWDNNRFDAQIPCLGRHNVLNALAAFCVGLCLDIPPDISVAALKNYRPSGMRQNIVVHNSYTVVEDCYNASPDSMRAAFETLGGLSCAGRRILALSDMLELGKSSADYHFEIGAYAAQCGIDYLICTGELSKNYVDGAKSKNMQNAVHCKDKSAMLETLKDLLKTGDVVWFKSSRGMKLEEVLMKIYEA